MDMREIAWVAYVYEQVGRGNIQREVEKPERQRGEQRGKVTESKKGSSREAGGG